MSHPAQRSSNFSAASLEVPLPANGSRTSAAYTLTTTNPSGNAVYVGSPEIDFYDASGTLLDTATARGRAGRGEQPDRGA